MKENDVNIMNLTPIEELITEDFGAIGTPERDQFEMECDAFIIDNRQSHAAIWEISPMSRCYF